MARVPVKSLFITKLLEQLKWQIADHGVQNIQDFPGVIEWLKLHPDIDFDPQQTCDIYSASRFFATRVRSQLECSKTVLAKNSQIAAFEQINLPKAKLNLIFDPLWLEFESPIEQLTRRGQEFMAGCLVFTDRTPLKDVFPVPIVWMLFFNTQGHYTNLFRMPIFKNGINLETVQNTLNASDSPAILPFTRQLISFLYLLSDPMIRVTRDEAQHQTLQKLNKRQRQPRTEARDFYRIVFVEKHKGASLESHTGIQRGQHAVRGHWRLLTKNPHTQQPYPEPRATWIRPHLRGTGEVAVQSLWKLREPQRQNANA